MNRQTALVVGLAVLSILAVGLAAATLTSTVVDEEGGERGESVGTDVSMDMPVTDSSVEYDHYVQTFVVFVGLAVLFSYVYFVLDWRRVLYFAAVILVIVAAAMLYAEYVGTGDPLQTFESEAEPPEPDDHGIGESEGEGEDNSTDGDFVSSVLVILLSLVGIALFVVLAFYSQSIDGVFGSSSEPKADEDDRSAQLGEIAGRAADRIDAAEPSETTTNEVYRAWQEMTDYLDVSDPESTTPREFATAAVETGMEPDDIDDLTRLFEEVRYGGRDPTEDRERRAIDILRCLERRYTDDT